jgi:hypothetical protein
VRFETIIWASLTGISVRLIHNDHLYIYRYIKIHYCRSRLYRGFLIRFCDVGPAYAEHPPSSSPGSSQRQAHPKRRAGAPYVFRRRVRTTTGRTAAGHDRPWPRCRLVHLDPQHRLLQRLPVHQLRPALRAGGDDGADHQHQRQHRRRSALAAHLRRQHRLHRLAAGQFLPRDPCNAADLSAPRRGVRSPDDRKARQAGGALSGRGTDRRRPGLHARGW